MSKTLELTVYPKDRWWYYRATDGDPFMTEATADAISARKYLTEPELAAEYHSAWAQMLDVPRDERYSYEPTRIAALLRFASLPHYDQAAL